MSLKNWENNGWLRKHKTSVSEISDLFQIVERDLKAAQTKGLSADWKFGIAYNAALKLCTILLNAEGYRPENNNAHFRTLQALCEILGSGHKLDANYLNTCRSKRNAVEYDRVNGATEEDAHELLEYGHELKRDVLAYLAEKHPGLLKTHSSPET